MLTNSSNRRILIVVLTAFLFIFTGCGTVNKMEFYENTKSTNLVEEVNKISINSSESSIREVFGEPDQIEKPDKLDKSQITKSTYLIYGIKSHKDNISFELIDGKVVRYFYSSEDYKTSKGIIIGNTKKAIIQAYGKNYYEREDTGNNVIGYFDKTQKINIEFSLSKVLEGVIVSKIN